MENGAPPFPEATALYGMEIINTHPSIYMFHFENQASFKIKWNGFILFFSLLIRCRRCFNFNWELSDLWAFVFMGYIFENVMHDVLLALVVVLCYVSFTIYSTGQNSSERTQGYAWRQQEHKVAHDHLFTCLLFFVLHIRSSYFPITLAVKKSMYLYK